MLVATAVLAGAGFLAVASGVDAGGGSSWFMEKLVGAATSVWSYALVLLLLFAVIRVTQRSRAATAQPREPDSPNRRHRLASEAQTADGASTVVVSPADKRRHRVRPDSRPSRRRTARSTSTGDTHVLDDDIVTAAEESAEAAEKLTLWSTTVRTWTRASTPTSVVSNWRARSTVATCSGRSPSWPA